FNLNIEKQYLCKVTKLIMNLYQAFDEKHCMTDEINPLVTTKDGEVMALDAKMNFEENDLKRQKEIVELRYLDEENRNEIEASKYYLSYIQLDGNIGCMVNGAGLAMSTMDIIKYHGGNPDNFLDVGGDATPEKVAEAFKIILSDKEVKGIFVNVFGGIMKCDYIAQGIIEATKQFDLEIPLVVRLEGTNVDLGKQMLEESGLNITSADSMADGADKIVKMVQEVKNK